ncbi:TPA: restriction endonuclease subunit S [Escherichia coli]|uniref:restriction endonuclease subunit S n=1 Tax=Enterobacter asburiae TaxID=61645 RepID=UPI0012B6E5D9|nr:restriction endonuclease subunit S [Enterobacter asburiae]MEB8316487.1 restriction endonuclease subunit S [Escherichia coli]HAJ4608861.1 restriction endonuclease subunit S [Escherichia coli]HBE5364271.1 restriction endonuclease subunit S [Escherichia coli]
MVPKGWTLGTLKDLADTIMGYAFRSEDFVPTGIPLLRMGNLYQNTLDLNRNPVYLPDSFKVDYKRFLVSPGDLVMSMTGTMGKRDYGFTVEIPSNTQCSLLNQRVLKIVPKNNASSGYILNLLRSELILSVLYSFPGGTKQANLSAKQLQELPVLIPPELEQKKIAQILSTWDKAISVTEKLLTNSQQQKKALMQQLLTGKKRLLDERGVRFSGEWEYTIFGNLGDTYTGLTGKTKEDFGAGKPYIPYINIFKNSRIDIQNLEYVQVNDDERQSVVKYGDIFFTTSSETPEEVGMSSVLLEEVSEVFLNSFCFGFRLNNFETLIPKYARYLFRSEHVRRQISTLGQGATRYNLSKRQLIKLELKLPCVEEQQKIAAVLSAADAEISTLEKKLACLRDEKKALMQQLLTGKRRVKVDEAVAE